MAEQEILVMKNISKRFGVVEALNDVSFSIRRGEIHTVLGENGAGKSTLMKIIKGELKPDAGTLSFEGEEIKTIDPLYANSIGITMVHQELTIFEDLTVAENIFPNNVFRTKLGLIDKRKLLQQSSEQLEIFNVDIDPSDKITNLPLAEQRIVEILRAIGLERKLIILDEPTSGLNEREVTILMSILKKLRNEGITIVYISHRIPEVMEISDRITILKDGMHVSTVENDSIEQEELIRLMVGREVDVLYSQKETDRSLIGEKVLELTSVELENFLKDVNLSLHQNEILGIFGLQGSGIDKLSQVLFGLDSFDSGSMKLAGKELKNPGTDAMIQYGFIYLHSNRKKAGLFFDMSAADNMACPVLDTISNRKILKKSAIHKYTDGYIEKFNIVIPNVQTKPKNLSGGNQQKLMFSICLGTKPKCVVLNEPTRGVDVGAKAEIHKFILGLPNNNASVIIFSSEIPELKSLCDRVLVMHNNTISMEVEGDEIDDEIIMAHCCRE